MSVTHPSAGRDTKQPTLPGPTKNKSFDRTLVDLEDSSFPSTIRRDKGGILYDPTDMTTSPRATVNVQGFSLKELAALQKASKSLTDKFHIQRTIRESLPRDYSELATFNPFPKLEFLQRMGQWVMSGFGLMKTALAAQIEERESCQSKISRQVRTIKNIHNEAVALAVAKVEADAETSFKGRSFLMTPETPKLLKRISIPVGKTHLEYEELQRKLQAAHVGGSRIRVECPSENRTIIHRQRQDNSWESLEVSWRRPGKVDIIINGVHKAHLWNEDGLKAAQRFSEGRKLSFTRTKIASNSAWKVL